MKIDLSVDKIKEEIVDSTEGQQTVYRMLLEGEDRKVVVVSPEPFSGFTPGLRVTVTIANSQQTLG